MRTCSCARANDAKIVRSRDAQCNTKEYLNWILCEYKILSCKKLIKATIANSLHLVYLIHMGPCKRAAGKATWPLREFVLVIGTTKNMKLYGAHSEPP